MGKIKQGILGGFNGTTGSVVGASWKGIAYMRGKAQSIKNPRTTFQMQNRGNFGFISDLMSRALSAINDGFRFVSDKKSPFNSAVQENMGVMVDSRGDLSLENAQFSKGSLIAPSAGSVTASQTTITSVVNCVGNAFEGNQVDTIYVFADATSKPLYVAVSRASVQSGAQTVTSETAVPANVTFDTVHVFSFVYDAETKKASPTIYVGQPE